MNDDSRKLISSLSSRYLKEGFEELRASIEDNEAPSWAQLHLFVELCRKTIESLEKNPPETKNYYSTSIIYACGPEDFLISVIEIVEEAFEKSYWNQTLVMEFEEQEFFSTALQIIGKHLGLVSNKEITIFSRSNQCYRIDHDPYTYQTNFDLLQSIGSNLRTVSDFVRNENLYSSPSVLASVVHELEAEYRHLSSFLNWFRQYIEVGDWLERSASNTFCLLAQDAPAIESNSIRFANRLRECASKINRIAKELIDIGRNGQKFQKDDPNNVEISDSLGGYLGGLESAIRRLKEQLSEKEEAERRREEEIQNIVMRFSEDPVPILEPSERPDMENRQ